jgi:acyl-CoA thioesterase-1
MLKIFLVVMMTLLPWTVSAKTIVVLGDSISAGFGIEVQQGWVALLQNRLAAQHSPYVISNESISGDTSAGGLARIDDALRRHKPQIVLIELGANDGLRGLSPEAMKANLTEMVKRAEKSGAKVLLLAMKIPPNYGKRYIEMFYNIYPQLAAELKVPYVPFILEDVALKTELMQADGLHPNALAQAIVAERIWGYLAPMLK